LEAGKAIGSVRAGHITLCQEAGIQVDDIETAYMSGASGLLSSGQLMSAVLELQDGKDYIIDLFLPLRECGSQRRIQILPHLIERET